MAQAQVEHCTTNGLQLDQNQVTFVLDERFSITVKRQHQDVYVLLKSGKKSLKIPFHVYGRLCTAQLSVGHVKAMLEDNCLANQRSICCYCGLIFTNETDCIHHEDIEHNENAIDVQMMDCN